FYVRGEDYAVLQRVAGEALRAARTVRGIKDADMSFRAGKPELSLQVDRAKAADLGVSIGTVAQTVRLALEGDVVAKFQQGERDWDVRFQLSPQDRGSSELLEALTVPATGSRMGLAAARRLVRLSDVARRLSTTGPATIERMNRQR